MKKERKQKLEVNRVSVSKLNHIKGGNPIVSIDICVITTEEKTILDQDCKTGLTILDGSIKTC
jgi:hypothetical protein